MSKQRIESLIRDIPDFPKPGIVFKDIAPVLGDPEAFRACTALFAERANALQVDKIAAIDARGFLFGAALAQEIGIGLVPVRKKGKLPYKSVSVEYDLEYGSAILEMHEDAVTEGDKVLVIDDLLATGGTAVAACQLVEQLGAEVLECAFLVELTFLEGRKALGERSVFAPVVF